MENEMPVFKSFLREQLVVQKQIHDALKNQEYEKAEKLMEEMIERTQQNIEDN